MIDPGSKTNSEVTSSSGMNDILIGVIRLASDIANSNLLLAKENLELSELSHVLLDTQRSNFYRKSTAQIERARANYWRDMYRTCVPAGDFEKREAQLAEILEKKFGDLDKDFYG